MNIDINLNDPNTCIDCDILISKINDKSSAISWYCPLLKGYVQPDSRPQECINRNGA